ncbi:ABC transporter substrate-binding protein [Parafrankia elaeagni]|uniref:ABC transporter substrate-binding protein n=1 Tax=Parafrankia elaeagni TaxID=222534 RepID=UPI0012B65B34|nr:ABC transporter substrate-binding protein [Parafrankia elaeagni]
MTGRTGRVRGRRLLLPALVAALSMFAAAACGDDTTSSAGAAPDGEATTAGLAPLGPDAEVTIKFLSYNFGTPGLGGTGTQALIDAFEKAHPNITVEPQGVATKDVLTRLRTDTAAGSPPDVAQIGWSKMAEAVQVLPIVPVEQIPPVAEWDEHVAGISKQILTAVEFNGAVEAMPYTMSIPVLYYNADLFRAAGLDPNNPPATIEAVKDAALKIKAGGNEGVYYGIADASKSDFLTQSVINSNGGSLVDAQGEITLDAKPAVDALATMQDLTESGAMPSVNTETALTAFTTGKLGMLVTSTSVLAAAMKAAQGKFELGTAAFPTFGSKPARPTYSGAGLAVLAKDDEHKRAAWEFVKFATSEAGFEIITKGIGYLPLRESVATRLASEPIVELLQPSLEQLDTVTPYTAFPGSKANQAVVVLQDEAVEPIVLRDADPASTLSSVADKIRKLGA